jgi:hypothetical protein
MGSDVRQIMWRTIISLMFVAVFGCSTTGSFATTRKLQQVDPILARERSRPGFEQRLQALGAKIETGANPSDERIALFVASPTGGSFSSRVVRIAYAVTDDRLVEIRSVQVSP